MGRTKSGILSILCKASSDHFTLMPAPDSMEDSIEENGQLPPAVVDVEDAV
jgi:hypothetical protein